MPSKDNSVMSVAAVVNLFHKAEAEQSTALSRFWSMLQCTSDATVKDVLKPSSKKEPSELTKALRQAGMSESTSNQRVSEMRTFRTVYVGSAFAVALPDGTLTHWTPPEGMGWHPTLELCRSLIRDRTVQAAADKAAKFESEVYGEVYAANKTENDATKIREIAEALLEAKRGDVETERAMKLAKGIVKKYKAVFAAKIGKAILQVAAQQPKPAEEPAPATKRQHPERKASEAVVVQVDQPVVDAAPVVETEVVTA